MAAIHAVMSFTVSRRTREIGVRVALGSDPRRILTTIFRRPVIQLGPGILAGTIFVGGSAIDVTSAITWRTQTTGTPLATLGWQLLLVAGCAALVILVCLLACVVPTRRALRVQPIEALRADV